MTTSGLLPVIRRTSASLRAALVMLLALLGSTVQALDTQVNIYSVYPVIDEGGQTNAQFLVVRNDATNAVTVNFSVTGTAGYTVDYTTAAFSAAGGSTTATGSIAFAIGEVQRVLTIAPATDLVDEGAESISIALEPNAAYQLGNFSSAQVLIADDDLVARITRPDTVATEDGLDAIAGLDTQFGRRAVFSVTWTPDTGVAPVSRGRTIRVRFDNPAVVTAGVATLGTDYIVHHKIAGSTSSYIGCVTTPTETTGLGYQVYGHLIGENVIQVAGGSAAIPVGAQVRFGDSLVTYNVSASSTGSGTGTITLNTNLTENIANNASVTVLVAAGTAPSGYAINVPYPVGTTSMKIGGGANGVRVGDVFMMDGDDVNQYVVTASSVGGTGQGTITFRRFIFDAASQGGSGLGEKIEGVVAFKTYFESTLAGANGNVVTIDLPAESNRIDFSITPKSDDTTGPEGAELVTMTMDKSIHYRLQDPTSSTVTLADADISASITTQSNAQRPSTSGKFIIDLTGGTFPAGKNVTLNYGVFGTAVSGTDYQALAGSVTIPAGQDSAEIEVQPLTPGTAGTQTVTVVLLDSHDVILTGSTGSGRNASATMNISDSVGTVTIAAGPNDAREASTPTTGSFVFTLNRTAPGPINVNYSVSGSAASSRYQALGTVQIAGTTATLTLTPIDNSLADGTQDVIVTLLPGDGYGLGTATSAVVRILDDEPTVSVSGVLNASKGGADGRFTVSYGGTALSRAIRVYFELTGDAVLNTDFSTSAVMTQLTPPYRGYVNIPGTQNTVNVTIAGIETPADGADKTLTMTILPDAAYTIGVDERDLTITGTPNPSTSKPTPGSINSGSSGGGCGLGSGVATLVGLGLFALLALRRRHA